MKVIGIVAEYNPFHNGHRYQIDKVKELFPLSVIVVALSSHYTLRGEMSVLSKWDKTIISLKNRVDIVLEIPFVFSNQSADLFSYAAIRMLSEFGVDTIVFGSESADKEFLIANAKIQIDNPQFDSLVKRYMSEGANYPSSLAKAIKDLCGEAVKEPNDILAVSYIKEILRNNYDMEIMPIKRTNGYLDISLDDDIVSASNIRNRLRSGENVDRYVGYDASIYLRKIDYELFFNLIKYKIISERESLLKYNLVNEGLENRIYEACVVSNSFDELVENIKTKRYTYNKINRILINIFTGFTKEMASKFRELEYIRVLGLSKRGKRYFSSIKKEVKLPVISKFEKYDMLSFELQVTMLYSLIVKSQSLPLEEIKNHTIIFDEDDI